jgi:hypothetical protein
MQTIKQKRIEIIQKQKKLLLPQKTDLSALTTQDVLNRLQKKLKVPNGNTVDRLIFNKEWYKF